MKLLHTSDWHLGKHLFGYDFTKLQQEMVDEIASVCEEKKIDLVVLSGHVFDSRNPSPEAVEVFLQAVSHITDGGARALVIVAQEGDAVELLRSFSHLSKAMNLAVITDISTISDIDLESHFRVKPVETGRGYVSYQNEREERFLVAGLPTANQSKDSVQLTKNIDSVSRRFSDDGINILVSGLQVRFENALGGVGDSEFTCDIFPPNTTYVALGGMHKNDTASLDKNVYYSGSIAQYDFEDKGEKGVNIVTINDQKEVKKEFYRLKSSKKLRKVRSNSVQDACNQLERFSDNLIALELTLPQPLSESDHETLRQKYGNLLQLKLKITQVANDNKSKVIKQDLPPNELFRSFYTAKNNGNQPSNDLCNLYVELMGDET